ncbi:BA75_01523T0 [Komagataella pastoris]|uniref:BA75_01523T0 n=1 Tax=Komagataella pastoris TaxID=4922 RepID=A0A1B2JA98_PICPA|nr:BA75_01523T0 [Komagataella pastoris]
MRRFYSQIARRNPLVDGLEKYLNSSKVASITKNKISTVLSSLKDQLQSQDEKYSPYTIKVGIYSHDTQLSLKLTKALLVDPLDPKTYWSDYEQSLDIAKNNVYQYGDRFQVDYNIESNYYKMPSPFLSSEYRPVFKEKIKEDEKKEIDNTELGYDRQYFNDISIVQVRAEQSELNDGSIPKVNSSTIDLDKNLNTNLKVSTFIPKILYDCHFIVHLKSNLHDTLPSELSDNIPVFTIVNRNQPIANHITVDVDKAIEANELLMKSPSNSTQYLNLLDESNIHQLLNLLNIETSKYNPIKCLSATIINDLYVLFDTSIGGSKSPNEITLTPRLSISKSQKDLEKVKEQLLASINDWRYNAHIALQTKVIPYVHNEVVNKFSKVHRNLAQLDDLNVVISSKLFDENTDGFLGQEIIKFNQLVGRISALSTDNLDIASSDIPLLGLKQLAKDDKLLILQNQISDYTIKQLFVINIPTILVSTGFFVKGFWSGQSFVAVVLLGLAISLNDISRTMFRKLSEFEKWYVNSLRERIDQSADQLTRLLQQQIKSTNDTLIQTLNEVEELEASLATFLKDK